MSNFDVTDTIAAIASPSGPAVRGIVRVSGSETGKCLAQVFEFASSDSDTDDTNSGGPHPLLTMTDRTVIQGSIRVDDQTSIPGELMFWPDQRSFTRQPTAEFHMIGSPVLLKMTLAAICQHGARLAGPGEFTLRAFLSGRIDLTQAEAVLAVIDSANSQQLDGALKQLSGGLAGPLAEIRDTMLSLLAELEAGLDFVEEDIEFISKSEIETYLGQCLDKLREINRQINSRSVNQSEFNVALAGKPNAGKSSLFNTLVDDQRAIVTDVEGTTRDYISAPLALESDFEIQLIDTAGVESGSAIQNQSISAAAQTMAHSQIHSASLRLFCITAPEPLSPWHLEQLAMAKSEETIVVLTKSDLIGSVEQQSQIGQSRLSQIRESGFTGQVVTTSSIDQTGIAALKHAIQSSFLELQNSESPIVATTVVRVSDSIRDAELSAETALQAAKSDAGQELVAAEVRTALDALGRVVGTIYTDDILDLVFGRFCIGK